MSGSLAILALTTVAVLVIDQSMKLLLHRIRFKRLSLGPFGSLRLGDGQLWVHRLGEGTSRALWLWVLPAGVLIVGSAWIPASRAFVGLVLGGSLSNATEAALRGSVTDYVCLRFWPAFNVADVAIAAGTIGIAIELIRVIGGTAT